MRPIASAVTPPRASSATCCYAAERIRAEIANQHNRLAYLQEKASLWDARARGDGEAEASAQERVHAAYHRLEL